MQGLAADRQAPPTFFALQVIFSHHPGLNLLRQ
jgi:hypothetical protein